MMTPTAAMSSSCKGALRSLVLVLWLALAAAMPASGRAKKKPLEVNTLAHFIEFCRRFVVLDNGKPLELEPFQRAILVGYFDGVTEIVVLLPKKNGKTTLLAALALYHLIYTPDAACYIAASAKDQARILYEQACGFVTRRDAGGRFLPQAKSLQKRVILRGGTKEIRSRRDSGFIRVVSGDKDTVDGVIPTLALVDELHRHKDGGELYGVLADGLGPREGQIITISTAGQTLRSVLGRIREASHKLVGIKRDGKHTFVRSANGQFEFHEWALEPDENANDLRLVKQANPLKANTVEKLRQRKKSPAMRGTRWARFACGQWVQGEDAALSAIDWGNAGRAKLKLRKQPGIYLGLDVANRWDTTAVVPGEPHDEVDVEVEVKGHTRIWRRYKRVRFGAPTVLVPPRNGQALRREKTIEAVLDFKRQGYVILGVIFDRNAGGEAIAQDLEEKHGLTVIQHSQDPAPMAEAAMALAEAVSAGEVEHPNDPEFNRQMLAAKAKTTSGEKWRFVAPEQRRGQRKHGVQDGDDIEVIDCAIAAAMLFRTVTAPRPPEFDPSAYRIEAL